MKTLLFKRRVLNGNRSDNFLFTAPEGTEEILPFGQEGTSQKLTGDWELHYAQQTSPFRVAATMAYSLEEFPVERINSKYFIGDNTTNEVYHDELSAPSHLKNCVHGSESESYGTIYFIEVVDASQPASFYMEEQQLIASYVPFMGWFTASGRNRSRRRRTENTDIEVYGHIENGEMTGWNFAPSEDYPTPVTAVFSCYEKNPDNNNVQGWNVYTTIYGDINVPIEENDTVFVHCIEAVHIDQEGDESLPYCWEVPKGMEIEIGDTLVVESRVGSQHIVVVATTEPYSLERYTATGLSVDTESNHPYCAVVYNCGKL